MCKRHCSGNPSMTWGILSVSLPAGVQRLYVPALLWTARPRHYGQSAAEHETVRSAAMGKPWRLAEMTSPVICADDE